MALNPQLDRAPVPTGVGYSSGAGSGDRSGALLGQAKQATLEGLGATLETLANTADTTVKHKIYADVNKEVDATRALFGVDDATTVAAAGGPGIPPADVEAARAKLTRLQNAYETGAIKPSDYYARLTSQTKQLKSRFPGYEAEVDQMIQSSTGVNPANALVTSLRQEADAAASAKDAAAVRWENYEKQNQGDIERALPGYFLKDAAERPNQQVVMDAVSRLQAQDARVSSLKAELELKQSQRTLGQDVLLDGARQVGAERSTQIISGAMSVIGNDYQEIRQRLSEALTNPTEISAEEQGKLQMETTQLMLAATTQLQTELSTGAFATLNPADRNAIIQDALKPIQSMVDAINNKDYGLLQAHATVIKATEDAAARKIIQNGGEVMERIIGMKAILPPEAFSQWMTQPENLSAIVEATRLSVGSAVGTGEDVTLNGTIDELSSTPGVPANTISTIVGDAIRMIANPMAGSAEVATRNIEFLYGPGANNVITRFNDTQQATIFAKVFAPDVSAAIKQQWAKDNPDLFAMYKKSAMTQFQQISRPLIDDINQLPESWDQIVDVSFNRSTGQLEVRPSEGMIGNTRFDAFQGTVFSPDPDMTEIAQRQIIEKYRDLNKLLLSLKGIYDVEGKDFGNDVDLVLQTMGVRYSNPLSPDERQERPDLSKRKVSDINPTVNDLLTFVQSLEAPGGFNQVSGGALEDLENMTVNEVLDLQRSMIRNKETPSSAVGGMQIIRKTLAGLVESNNLTGDEFFTEDLQRQLGIALMEGRGLQKYLNGKITADQFADNLAKEWAALPLSNGRSAYAGVGKNKALTDRATVLKEISKLSGNAVMQYPDVDLTEWELDPELLPSPAIDEATLVDEEGNYITEPTSEPDISVYDNIPDVDGNGNAGQKDKFMQWNNDPVGNHATRLASVKPELQSVVTRAQEISGVKFVVASGKRTAEEQALAREFGWSTKKDSRHEHEDAVDIWVLDENGKVTFEPEKYKEVAAAMEQAATELEVPVDWGGSWKSPDIPHFELSK